MRIQHSYVRTKSIFACYLLCSDRLYIHRNIMDTFAISKSCSNSLDFTNSMNKATYAIIYFKEIDHHHNIFNHIASYLLMPHHILLMSLLDHGGQMQPKKPDLCRMMTIQSTSLFDCHTSQDAFDVTWTAVYSVNSVSILIPKLQWEVKECKVSPWEMTLAFL